MISSHLNDGLWPHAALMWVLGILAWTAVVAFWRVTREPGTIKERFWSFIARMTLGLALVCVCVVVLSGLRVGQYLFDGEVDPSGPILWEIRGASLVGVLGALLLGSVAYPRRSPVLWWVMLAGVALLVLADILT